VHILIFSNLLSGRGKLEWIKRFYRTKSATTASLHDPSEGRSRGVLACLKLSMRSGGGVIHR
jgi:hypothetical protein